MTTKTLIGLAAALVVLTVLAIYGQRSGETPGAEEIDRAVLPALEPALDGVDRVSVVGGGNEPVATLLRREDRWVVAEKDEYPADIGRIREVLRGLAEARVVERKTSNPAYYDRLGVSPIEDEQASGVAVRAYAGDAEVAAVIVGDSAGSGYHYLRPLEAATSFMVDRELDVPRDVSEWVDPNIVDIRGARVREVEIEHPDGETLRISKDDDTQANFTVEGVPEGRELQYPGVANVIGNALRELRLEDVAAADGPAGAGEPVRTTYRTFDGLVVTIAGTTREDGAWIEVEASAEGAAATAASDGAETSPETDVDGAAAATDEADPEAEAAAINARVDGWRYRIPGYQFDQMTRRIEDLLKPEDAGESP